MFDSKPWSDNPNAPKIPRFTYFEEKATLAGVFIASILYGTHKPLPLTHSPSLLNFDFFLGTLVVLFFQCMAGLLDPVRRRKEGIRWGLVSHTIAMFSFATVYTATNLSVQSITFIDNREFPGIEGVFPPGPIGYQWLNSEVLCVAPDVMFFLNNWLADGLLVSSSYDSVFTWPSV